jgi:ABC-2 type transport system permease protein
MRELVAAEWLKLRTTRLPYGMVGAAIGLAVAAVAGGVLATARSDTALTSTRGLDQVLSLAGTGALVTLLTGILVAAGEYRHGTATDTFLTAPRRHRVVIAKLAVGAALGLATGLMTATTGLGTAAALFQMEGDTLPLGDGEVWLILAGTLGYATLFAVLGVALGTLIRNQVLAVAVALAWIGIVEHILISLAPAVGRWLPAMAGQAVVRAPIEEMLPPLGGLAVLTTYAVVVGAFGLRAAVSRDV